MSGMSLGPSQVLVEANEQLVLAMLQAVEDAERSAARLGEVTLASHLDALTGLPDRLLFFDRLAQAIVHARRHGSRLAVLFVDLDHFKHINDTLGHAAGDRVLRAAAYALQTTVREADTVSRHGGDEFLVLLGEIQDAEGSERIARKLCEAIETSRELASLGVRLTASIGVCVYPDDGSDARTLIANADFAMYRAKKARNAVSAYAGDAASSSSGHHDASVAVVDATSIRPPSRRVPDDEGRFQQLRAVNERLLIAALDAQTAPDGAARVHPYRALINRMDDGAVAVDGDGNLLFGNRRFVGLVGTNGDDLVGTPFSSFFATLAEAQLFRSLLARVPSPDAFGNFALLDAKGASVPVRIEVVDVRMDAAVGGLRVVACLVTVVRCTGSQEHALALLNGRLREAVIERFRSERRLEIALEAAQMGSMEVDLASGELGWTHRHDRIFGATGPRTPMTLRDIFEQVDPEDRDRVEQAFSDAVGTGSIDIEHRIRRIDTGDVRWVHLKAVALPDAARNARVVGFVADITERRAVADQLRQAQKMEAVGQLTTRIAHDFDQLLLVIGGSIEALARSPRIASDESAIRPLASARKSVQYGARLTQRLLAFARHQAVHTQVQCMDDLVPEFVELIERAIGDGITLRVDRLADAWLWHGDCNRLALAILNLAINARDAMPDGGLMTLAVSNVTTDAMALSSRGAQSSHYAAGAYETGTYGTGQYAAISVEDTGTGMSPDVMRRAFAPLFTTKPPGVGTGLGLSQVYGFVSESGGFVSIDSEPGRGTRVTIHMPRHRQPEAVLQQ